MISLNVEKRDMRIDLEKLRGEGKLPAVFYGPKEKSTPIIVSMKDFIKAWKKAGESSVIVIKEGKNEYESLINDIDIHPITGVPRHADFYILEKGKKVKVHVPLVFEGVSDAVKDKGGILVKVLRELEIEAEAKDLPHELRIDISLLTDLTSVIMAKDVNIPAGVTLISNKDEIVTSIAVAKEEVEEVKPVDMSTIEVVKKGKEAKEGEEIVAETSAEPAKKEEKKKEEKK